MLDLYEVRPEYPDERETNPARIGRNAMSDDVFRDYRGTVCPMNFVKVKVDLSKMAKGQTLKVLLDDGDPIENVPKSVELQGHEVVGTEKEGDHWSMVVRKH